MTTLPTPHARPGARSTKGPGWWPAWRIPIGLIALSVVPAAGGIARVGELASSAAVTDDNRRFFDAPLPILVHIVAVILFSFAGALQFAPRLRARGRRWHRIAGRIIVPAGFATALSGLWLTAFSDLPDSDNATLSVFRYVVGAWMLVTLIAGVAAVRACRFRAHGEWMSRAYGIGLGAGTQVFTHIPWIIAFGTPSASVRAWLMFAGWAINAAVVELVIRHRRTPKDLGSPIARR